MNCLAAPHEGCIKNIFLAVADVWGKCSSSVRTVYSFSSIVLKAFAYLWQHNMPRSTGGTNKVKTNKREARWSRGESAEAKFFFQNPRGLRAN